MNHRFRFEQGKSCELEPLASGPLVRIERCQDCGTLSLHLGAISLRLDRSAAESLWTTLGEALGTASVRGAEGTGRFARA
jgi:hypothetical protein